MPVHAKLASAGSLGFRPQGRGRALAGSRANHSCRLLRICALLLPTAVDHHVHRCALVPMQVLGTDSFYAYLNKYGLELDPQLEALVGRHR